jgi:PPK2 family polyphosphate:nucleotide phosphotransferase
MYATKIDKPDTIKLNKVPTDADGGLKKEVANKRFAELEDELSHLQELLCSSAVNGLLVVVQGLDAAGKDGTMDKVGGTMNPVDVRVASFKVPTPEEAKHDFLWRVHAQTPGKGEVVFFNRSHYEDVLVTRVHHLVEKSVWVKRYDTIVDFERQLVDSGIIILKFYLHVSKDEQKKRLLERETTPEKAWKLNVEDWKERAYWEDYTAAYEDAIGRCAAPHAPWFIIPADHKWFRDLAIAEALVETLRPHKKAWLKELSAMETTQRAALAKLRADGTIEKPD